MVITCEPWSRTPAGLYHLVFDEDVDFSEWGGELGRALGRYSEYGERALRIRVVVFSKRSRFNAARFRRSSRSHDRSSVVSLLAWKQYCGACELLVMGGVELSVTVGVVVVAWHLRALRALGRAFLFRRENSEYLV